jgi:AraC-like DNA-binding protein
MITVNGIDLTYSNMGLFDSDKEWIHPTVTVDTYEIVYVVEGQVHIREGERRFDLSKGDLLVLEPGVEHGGTEPSYGRTSFYWMHYRCSAPEKLALPKQFAPDEVDTLRTLGELMHLQQASPVVAELSLARFLLECGREPERGNRRVSEICEFIRVNSARGVSVIEVAERFGYSADHLSRLLKKELGVDAKTAIVRYRMEYIESKLLNSDYSVKEIAAQSGFEDENAFVKFFKYHAGTTPSNFRNKYFHVHINNK